MIDERPWLPLRHALHGARIVVISNRDGGDQQRQIEFLLGSPVRWYVAHRNTAKIGAIETALASGNFDIVIGFSGWLSHNSDRACARAARRGNATYIRAYKGTPTMLLHALKRDLGL